MVNFPREFCNLCAAAIVWLASFVAALAGDSTVVLNEIHYHPDGSNDGEWVELYNLMAVDMELSGWRLASAVDFTFPPGTILPGGGYIVVAANPSQLTSKGATNVFGPFTGKLANEGELLELRNHNDRLMDSVAYGIDGRWPVAPGGSGDTLAKRSPQLASAEPESWLPSAQIGGTPGAANFPSGSPLPSPVVLSELGSLNVRPFWLELANTDTNAVDLSGRAIRNEGSVDARYILPTNTVIAAGGFLVLDQSALGWAPLSGDRIFLYTPGAGQVADAAVVTVEPSARDPDLGGRWLTPVRSTPGVANVFALNRDIVINEIQYQSTGAEAWIELYNRGTNAVDLTRWSFSEGIHFSFPPGTAMAPGEYLVVTSDTNYLQTLHPDIRILGNYTGQLSHHGEWITLSDAVGNPVNQVRYADRKPWPQYAAGGGSSLELRDPRSDNQRPEAWAASDESGQTAWKTYTYLGLARDDGGPTQWNEFVMGLLGAGEALLDDISVLENPGSATASQLIQNGSFENGSTAWRFLGNHRHSEVIPDPGNPTNHVLHLVATGATEHMHNHLETTYAGNAPLVNGRTYQISFRARWLTGSPQLNTRLYFDRLAKKTILDTPAISGTPGRRNSRYIENAGPTFWGLSHGVAVPSGFQQVTVSVSATDPDGVASCKLWWSPNGGAWQSATMKPGAGPLWQVTIPGFTTATAVQFYVEAVDGLGATSTYPAAGRDSRAMFQVKDGQSTAAPHQVRIIMTPADAAFQLAATNVMSNESLGATIVYDESEVFYDAGSHLQSSERGRDDQTRVGYTLEFNADHLFRGVQDISTLDRSGGYSGRGGPQDEIVLRQLINQAGGLPDMYNDLVRGIYPLPLAGLRHSSAQLLMEKYGSGFLDGAFTNGNQGGLFKMELIYYPTTSVNGDPQLPKLPQPDDVIGVDLQDLGNDPEAYRWHFLIENQSDRDDYSGIIRLAKAFGQSGGALDQESQALMDVSQWARAMAIKTLSGDADTYAQGYPHNQYVYFRPADGKALTFPWDMDFSWTLSPTMALPVGANIGRILALGPNQHLFYGHVLDLLSRTYNTNYAARWTAHYGKLAGQNYSGILDYIRQRNASARSQLPAKVPFAITTQGGHSFMVDAPLSLLRGTAWIDVEKLVVQGLGSTPAVTWTGVTNWQASVPLILGANPFQMLGYDFSNHLSYSNSIVIVSSENSGLDTDGDGMPDLWETANGFDPLVPDANGDADGDGMSNLQEFLAGTDPHDPHSLFSIGATANPRGGVTLSFTAQPGRGYSLQARDVISGGPWLTIFSVSPQISAQAEVYNDSPPTASASFYRVSTP